MSKLDSLFSWKTLVNAARIRNFEPILRILEEVEPDTVPDIWYHRKCPFIFTMKKTLERIKNEKESGSSECTSSQSEPVRRSVRSPSSELLLPKKCLICSKPKYIRNTRTHEKLVLCTDLRADRTLKMAALKKTDGKMMIACSHELVAKEVYYHRTCYQSFTREFLSNKNSESEHCSDKSTAFEKVANFLSHLIKNPQVVELTKLTSLLETQLLEEEVESETVIKSAKENLKRKIETEFTEINFVQIGRQCYAYPDTVEISEVITQLETTKKEHKELKALSDAEKLVTKCALTVREVKEKSVNLPWPRKTSELKNENFHCPNLLDLLYTIETVIYSRPGLWYYQWTSQNS